VLQTIFLLLLLLFLCSLFLLQWRTATNTVIGDGAVAAAAARLLYDAARVCCQLPQEGQDAASQQALQTSGNSSRGSISSK
jgi:hypothetical protein